MVAPSFRSLVFCAILSSSTSFVVTSPKLAFAQIAPLVHLSPSDYSPSINPLNPDRFIRSTARTAFRRFSSNDHRIRYLFNHLRSGAGFRPVTTRIPSTASETSRFGGDCSDLTLAFISAIRELNRLGAGIRYGAQVLQLGSPNSFHMIALVPYRGRVVPADLITTNLGEISQSSYSVSLTYPVSTNPISPSAMYHAEWGDYFRENRTQDPTFIFRAIAAYRRSLELFEQDPFVHGNLAFLCNLTGDTACQIYHNSRRDELRNRN